MFDPATFSEVERIGRRVFARRTICYILTSQQWTAPADGVLAIRCLGAAGSGGISTVSNECALGGEPGTVGIKTIHIKRGDVLNLVIGAGGVPVASYGNGNAGGVTTVTGPGVNISIPGGAGGLIGPAGTRNPQNAVPSGLDQYWLNARNTGVIGQATGGGAPALLVGRPAYAAIAGSWAHGAGVGGANDSNHPGGPGGAGFNLFGERMNEGVMFPADHSYCRLLLDVSGRGYSEDAKRSGSGSGGRGEVNSSRAGWIGGFGGGGGGASGSASSAGHGGRGAGGGGTRANYASYSGAGGAAAITLELLESTP